MKKLLLFSAVFIVNFNLFSQSGQKYATSGNSLATGDFFGSTNLFPIIFKVNNLQKMSLATNGVLQLNGLAGTGTRFLQTDLNGNVIAFPAGTASQVLYGNGVWGSLPPDNDPWIINGGPLTYAGNVLVNGSFTSGATTVSSLNSTGNISATGNISNGGTFTSTGAATFNNNLNVNGATTLSGTLKNTSFAGSGTRVVITDANGNISPLSAGTNSQYLNGLGQWINFPAIPAQLWNATGSNIYYNGNIGVNNPSPAYALDVTGQIRANSLSGSTARILSADANGVLTPIAAGAANQYLSSNLQWANLPAQQNVLWTQTGNNISYNGGSVGINNATPNAAYALDINGSAHVTNNLYVDGAILIGNRADINIILADTATATHVAVKTMYAIESIVTPQVSAAGIRTDTVFSSNINVPTISGVQKLRVNGGASFNGTLSATALSVPTLDLNQALTFNGGQARFGFTPTNGTDPNIISFGRTGGSAYRSSACFNTSPNSYVTLTHDLLQIDDDYFKTLNPNNINLLSMWYDGANDMIEAEGHRADNTKPGLLINYNCGSDVAICTGAGLGAGGFVFTGPNAQIGSVLQHRNPNTALNIGSNGAVTTAINVDANGANIFNVASTGNTFIKGDITNQALALTGSANRNLLVDQYGKIIAGAALGSAGSAWVLGGNSGTGGTGTIGTSDPNTGFSFVTNNKPCMTITPAGNVHIIPQGVSTQIIPNGVHANALLSVSGEAIFKSAFVNINTWSDYVFEPTYKLMSIPEVEKYYLLNKHLNGVPSAKEMEISGDNIAETDAMLMKKIEENTLYIVQLNKKSEAQEKKLEAQEKLISELNKKLEKLSK